MLYSQVMQSTPVGPLSIVASDRAITQVSFGLSQSPIGVGNTVTAQAVHELSEYFSGIRQQFQVPLAPQGTAFQQQVWAALLQIPYGKTCTYSDLAAKIGRPRAMRAVGMANHCNPLPIFIPCHRVIGKNGSLTGYAGGFASKRILLELEHTHLTGAPFPQRESQI